MKLARQIGFDIQGGKVAETASKSAMKRELATYKDAFDKLQERSKQKAKLYNQQLAKALGKKESTTRAITNAALTVGTTTVMAVTKDAVLRKFPSMKNVPVDAIVGGGCILAAMVGEDSLGEEMTEGLMAVGAGALGLFMSDMMRQKMGAGAAAPLGVGAYDGESVEFDR